MTSKDKNFLLGLDIGGTKCAVILGEQASDHTIKVIAKQKFSTADADNAYHCLQMLCSAACELLVRHNLTVEAVSAAGISCGGPLDPKRGIIQSPPNLPGWDNIPAVEIVKKNLNIPVKLENDANACALAEWQYGAGQGCNDMIFLTFGTGLGAGIIAGGRLISGCCGMAGECGHIRLQESGPSGYGKVGSFEGFCSGGGIAQLGKIYLQDLAKNGRSVPWLPAGGIDCIDAKIIADAANAGDVDALKIYEISGHQLGRGLAILVDLLNPERIVIGSVFARSENLLRPAMLKSLQAEALSVSRQACKIVPAALGEAVGDMASLALAASVKA
ncbi:MAG: ROK family protein [Lentisphaerae bacterium]|nr:ROK family protein [Lentisphaerota bacterium]